MGEQVARAATGSASRTRRRSRRLRGDDGAVLIEAAFVFPVLMLLIFGMVEFGLLYMNASTVSNATAAGARTAVTQSRQANYSTNAAAASAAALAAMDYGTPVKLIIYRANGANGLPIDGSDFESCSQCNVFTWGGSGWSLQSTGWPATSQQACGTVANTDYLGVWIKAQHNFLTSMFGSSKTISEHTMMRLEPVPSPCM